MLSPTLILFSILIAAHSANGFVLPKSKPCSAEEIMKPLNDIYGYVEEMRTPDADINDLKEKISKGCEEIPSYLEAIKGFCGEEKNESVQKITNFFDTIQTMDDVINALESEDKVTAKKLLENINCEHIIQIFVRHYGINTDNIKRIIQVISMMDDMNLINKMNEAITYVIDETNRSVSDELLSVMTEQIVANKDKVGEDVILAAKLNMKEIAKKNLPKCFCGVKALRKLDIEMADQAVYEVAFQLLTDSYLSPAFKMVSKAPFVHMQAIVLEAIFDKVVALEIQNSLVAARTLSLAKKLIENEEIKGNEKSMKILNDIINNSSIFAKNMEESGYVCYTNEEMMAIKTGKEVRPEEHNEYILFYDDEHPEKFTEGKFLENPDGELSLFTVSRKYSGKMITHSVVVNKANYPEDMFLEGDIVSKRTITKEATTREEICNMHPTPEQYICTPISKLSDLQIAEIYDKFLEYSKFCNRT